MPTAYVLDADDLAGSEAVTFPGFPGVWTPGEPIAAAEFVKAGAFDSVDEMGDRVAELGLPLKQTTVADGEGLMPARENHLPSQEQADATKAELNGRTPKSHAEADAIAADLGISFPPDAKLDKKKALIAEALAEPSVSDDPPPAAEVAAADGAGS